MGEQRVRSQAVGGANLSRRATATGFAGIPGTRRLVFVGVSPSRRATATAGLGGRARRLLSKSGKVYLDDERETPEGWVGVKWPAEMIALLETGEVTHISLDHDLGEYDFSHVNPRTGYDVLLWLEEKVFVDNYKPPVIMIHTANAGARKKMCLAAQRIHRQAKGQKHG